MADTQTTTLTAAAYTAEGTPRDTVALPANVFDGVVNVPVMHQAVKAYLANQRQGTASTKNRRAVTGGNQKPWRQKGTGRARQGSTRAPHWVGGGTVFGPTPREYTQRLNKKVKVLARRSALNARAQENALFVIDVFDYDAPKTQRLAGLLESMQLLGKKVLVLTDGIKPNVHLSGRNLPRTHVMPFVEASTYHVLWSDVVLVESGAIGESLAPVTGAAQQAPKAPRKRAAKKTAAEQE
jgi:large subunit ribosomal protein L4